MPKVIHHNCTSNNDQNDRRKEFLAQIRYHKTSQDDFEKIYKLLDEISKEGYQNIMSKAVEEGLCDKTEPKYFKNMLHLATERGNLRLVKSICDRSILCSSE